MNAARRDNESGAVLVIAALFMSFVFIPVLIVLVIGVSSWRTHRHHLQLQADAAAFAGGDKLGECFSNGGGASGTADADIRHEADHYAGDYIGSTYTGSPSLQNLQIPGATNSRVVYNSLLYGDNYNPGPDGTVAGTSCQAPYMLDVKASEQIGPELFGSLVSVTPRAHARVQLFKANVARGAFPIVVPEFNPTNVFVTLYDVKTNSTIKDCPLNGPVLNGALNLNMWASASPCNFTVPPADDDVGVRVGAGTAAGSCGYNVTGGTGYLCYDQTAIKVPLAIIRSYSTSGTSPFVRAVTESTCGWGGTSPFFSSIDPSPCGATVKADVSWGASCPNGSSCIVQATDSLNTTVQSPCVKGPLASGTYSFPFSYLSSAGQVSITNLKWKVRNNLTCTGGAFNEFSSYSPYQQAYGGSDDPAATGPVKVLAASSYALPGGTTQSVSFTVGLQPNITSQTPPYPALNPGNIPPNPLGLRVYDPKTYSNLIQCDQPALGGINGLKASIANGCLNSYQTQPPPGACVIVTNPPDCVPIFPAKGVGIAKLVYDGFSARFTLPGGGCAPNNLLNYNPLTDPRVTEVLFTDLQQWLAAQGGNPVPITNLGTFYITGWGYNGVAASCPGNDPPPPGLLTPGLVAIWGHFIPFVNPKDTGSTPCTAPLGITPCVPELTN